MTRNISNFLIFIVLNFLVAGCQQAAAPEPEKPKGLLRIATIPLDMPIIVNGQPKGSSPSGEGQYFSISLEEGEHKIEILKSVDEEKEQYAQKTIFIAADTLPIVTLEAKARLTPFGEQEKTRREAEAAEKQRLAEMKRKKEAAIKKENERLEEIRKEQARVDEIKRLEEFRESYKEHIGKVFQFSQIGMKDIDGYRGYYIGKITGFSDQNFKVEIKASNCEWDSRYRCIFSLDENQCTGNVPIGMTSRRRIKETSIAVSCIGNEKLNFLTQNEIDEWEAKNWRSKF